MLKNYALRKGIYAFPDVQKKQHGFKQKCCYLCQNVTLNQYQRKKILLVNRKLYTIIISYLFLYLYLNLYVFIFTELKNVSIEFTCLIKLFSSV